jgi:hypothetical protein
MAKTGTSTLQHTLFQHRRLLAQAGVLYPANREFQQPNHNGLTCLYTHELPRAYRARGNATQLADTARRLWVDIERQIDAAAPDVVILSSEYFFIRKQPDLRRYRDLFRSRFDDIDIVAYVRHPAASYVSVAQQHVKASHQITPPAKYRHRATVPLGRFRDVFGDHVTVRPYDRATLHEACVVRDFLHAFVRDGDALGQHVKVTDVNDAMSAEAMCILQQLRRFGWPDANNAFAAESNYVLRVLNEMRVDFPQTTARLRPDIGSALTHSHAEELAALRDQFDVEFASAPPALDPATMPEGSIKVWEADDFREILDIDAASVDHILFALLKELAARQLGPTASAGAARGLPVTKWRRVSSRLRARRGSRQIESETSLPTFS